MHLIQFIEIEKKRNIRKEVSEWFCKNDEYAHSPDDYPQERLIIRDQTVFDSYQDASDYLDEAVNSVARYKDLAIPFHDGRDATTSKKLEDVRSRIVKNENARNEYIAKNDIHNRKSKSVTCPCCDSRLTLSYLRIQKCPLCGTDLRSPTVLNRIQKFADDDKKLRKMEADEERKLSKKGPIKWLVKVEAHC